MCIPPRSEKPITSSSRLALEVVVCNQTDIQIDVEKLVGLVEVCCSELDPLRIKMVDIALVSKEVMANLHMRYKGLPGPTDVISFPASDFVHDPLDFVSPQGQRTLGDIVICPDFIEINTQSEPTQMNIDACVIHGMVHLLGHDHQNDDEAITMSLLESQLWLRWVEFNR